jgi:hypothetical protein
VNSVKKSFCPILADVPDLAVNASLAASTVVLMPAGALILAVLFAVLAAALKLLFVDRVIMVLSSYQRLDWAWITF